MLEDGIGVDRADVRMRRGVHAGVQRIRLASVFLVEDPQIRVCSRHERGADRRGRDPRAESLPDRDEVERLAHSLERSVGGAVVHDDHLVPRVAQVEQ